MKRYIKLTSDFKNFSAVFEKNELKVEWTCALNLTSIKYITLLNCQIHPLMSQKHGYAVSIYSNLIRGDTFNPRNEIASVYIPRNSCAIPNYSEHGES